MKLPTYKLCHIWQNKEENSLILLKDKLTDTQMAQQMGRKNFLE